jgi:hypothetical protein
MAGQNDNMNTDTTNMEVPKFESKVPEHLLRGKTDAEMWMYHEMSIQSQQNEWLMYRAVKIDKRQDATERRLQAVEERQTDLQDFRRVLTAKWSVVVTMASVGMVLLIEWVRSRLKR